MIDLSDYSAEYRTVESVLKDCLKDVGKAGAFKEGKKAIVICLDETDGAYDISWQQCKMKMSEIVSLLETTKHEILNSK